MVELDAMSACPSDTELYQFARGQLPRPAAAPIDAHLLECERCRTRTATLIEQTPKTKPADGVSSTRLDRPTPRVVSDTQQVVPDTVVRGTPAPAPGVGPAGSLTRGDTVGRYLVVELLGAGGMGEVYTAYDPQLDRRVALKLLRGGIVAAEEAHTRLLREAQALARLAHPHVIAVHDVGTFQDRVFVAMEFVDGQTLTAWLETGRSWQEIVGRFREAGAGLAAAHAAGLVHRDFKPDNVLLGKDGRVRVLDFGLARQVTTRPLDRASHQRMLESIAVNGSDSGVLGRPLTQDGTLMGTPAYMSLEQLEGSPTDARTDQFSFCVALYEALYHRRPYQGETLAELVTAMREAKVPELSRESKVPGFVHQALARGLAASAEARYPSMDALLQALAHDPARRRRRWAFVGGVAAGMVAMAAVPLAIKQRRVAACSTVVRQLDGIWDPARQAQIRQAFRDSQVPFAGDAYARIAPMLTTYTAGWTELQRGVCLDTFRSSTPPQELALRSSCLDERLDQLRAVSNVLASADKDVVENAVSAVQSLLDLRACSDVESLAAKVELVDPSQHEKVEEVHAKAAFAKALLEAGKYKAGVPLAQQAVTAAGALKNRGLEAESWYLLGRLQGRSGDRRAAERSFREAVWAAEAAHRDDLTTRGWARLLQLSAHDESRAADGEDLARSVTAAMERLRKNDEVEGEVQASLGAWSVARGQLGDAKAHLEKALELKQRALGPTHPEVALQLNGLGAVLSRMGKTTEARALHERALTLLEQAYGPNHPVVASPLHNLGLLDTRLGNYAEAIEHLERAVKIRETTLGADHPSVASSLEALAQVQTAAGDRAAALATETRLLSLREKREDPHATIESLSRVGSLQAALGRSEDALATLERALTITRSAAPSAQQAQVLERLAGIYRLRGRPAEAVVTARKAVQVSSQTLGAGHPATAHALATLAELELTGGKREQALIDYQRALAIHEGARPLSAETVAADLQGLGRTQLALHRPADAVATFERLVQLAAAEKPSVESAASKVALVRALIEAKQDPTRATSLLQEAKAFYDQTPAKHSAQLREIAELSDLLE